MRSRLPLLVPLIAYAASAIGFLAHSTHSRFGFPLDDAWIHRVYARSFAFAQGLAYNAGIQEAGSTSPLWAIVSSPVHWLEPLVGTNGTVLGVKLLGVLLGAAVVFFVFEITRRLTDLSRAAAIAATIVAVEPRLIFSALSGMENMLLLALWLGCLNAALAGRYTAALILVGLSPLARPEAALLIPVALVATAILAGVRGEPWRRPLHWAALVAPAMAWSLFCYFVNGHLLPNTYYMKAAPFQLGTDQLGAAWGVTLQHGWGQSALLFAGQFCFAGWLLLNRTRNGAAAACMLFAAPLLFLLAVVCSREVRLDGYYWTRWTDPAALVLTAAFAMGIGVSIASAFELQGRDRTIDRRRAFALVFLATFATTWLLLTIPRVGSSYLERRSRLASDSRAVDEINVEPALWLRENTPRDAVVGVNDAGAMRYFGERHMIDLGGLNNSDLAFRRTDPQEVVRRLDWVAVFPSWFQRTTLLEYFDIRKEFRIPLDEYTVCDCPGQALKVIGEKRPGIAN